MFVSNCVRDLSTGGAEVFNIPFEADRVSNQDRTQQKMQATGFAYVHA